MEPKTYSWKAEWLAAGQDPGTVSEDEQKRAEELKKENLLFLAQHPPKQMVAKIHHRAAQKKNSRILRLNFLAVPLAAAAALFVFFALPHSETVDQLEHLKGTANAQIHIYRELADGKAERLSAQAPVKAGDILQASYLTQKQVYGAILSVDGNKNVTVHLAAKGSSVPLVPGSEQTLAFSYELDKAPRYEIFFLFTSEKNFEIESLKQILKTNSWSDLKGNSFGTDISWTALPLKKDNS